MLLAALLLAALSACGKNNDAAHKHNYIEKVTKPATCVEEGVATYTCYGCGDTYTKTIPVSDIHKYKKTVIKEATCAEDGEASLLCELCGATKTEILPATGNHMYVLKEIQPSTCV